MQAAIRQTDRAIIEVSQPIAPQRSSDPITYTTLTPRDGADIISFTIAQASHWLALTLPPGEVMALAADGTIYVLEYATPDPGLTALRTALRGHADPGVRAAAQRLGII